MLSPTEIWARETARSLVTIYLSEDDDDLDFELMISDLIEGASKEQLGELLAVLIAAIGDTFDGLQSFSHTIIDILGGAPA